MRRGDIVSSYILAAIALLLNCQLALGRGIDLAQDILEKLGAAGKGAKDGEPGEDPFASILRDFTTGAGRLKEERDKKREEYKEAEASLKEAKKEVAELEHRLRQAKATAARLEAQVKEKKLAKQQAEQAVLRAYTDIAGNVHDTASRALKGLKEDSFFRKMPDRVAKAVLWGEASFAGPSMTLACCDYYDLSDTGQLTAIRSITLPEGVSAILHPTENRYLSSADSGTAAVTIFGSVASLDGLMDFRQRCCRAIQLVAGIEHSEETSVVLYSDGDFAKPIAAYLQGDFELSQPTRVGSVRVPAGLRATFYAGAQQRDGSLIAILQRDSRDFPQEETSTQSRMPALPVSSLKVRQISEIHGLFLYPDPGYEGRPQFFESGEYYLYPESWPDVRSAKVTNRSYARLFTEQGLVTIRTDQADLKESRPHAIEVSSLCDPPDYCGEHGRCVAPQKCSCSGTFQGHRCHLQTPDETSAIICERNVVQLGETLSCALQPRRYSQPCNATSLFLHVELHSEASGALYGSPVVVRERHLAGPAQDRSSFPFDAVFNSSFKQLEPFVVSVFGRQLEGAFVPQITVLPPVTGGDRDAHDVGQELYPRVRDAANATHVLDVARVLLRKGDIAAALDALQHCPPSTQQCATLRFTVLLELGRLQDAEAALASLAEGLAEPLRAKLAAARVASAEAVAAEEALRAEEDRSEASATARAVEAMARLARALEVSPLAAELHLRRGAAALEAGAFPEALAEVRRARQLFRASGTDGDGALLVMGRVLLALGLSDAARQNFAGCVQMSEQAAASALPSAGPQCKALLEATVLLHQDASKLRDMVTSQQWASVPGFVEAFGLHGRISPHFGSTTWGVEAAASLCLARHALNAIVNASEASIGEVLEPCRRVVAAPAAVQSVLDDAVLIQCHVALAEALAAQRSLQEALAAVEAAEGLLGSGHFDEMAALVRMLHERLLQAARAEAARKDVANASSRAPPPRRPERTDLYEILGLPRNATAAEIKRAYRQLALQYHPDKNSDPEAVQIFLEVQKAYQILSDEALRRRYDAGQENVADEHDGRGMKPMKFRVVETDRQRGIAKVWWFDPNTGEEGFMEMEIDKDDGAERRPSTIRELREHCCLPGSED